MGMDLLPKKQGAEDISYNWSGWKFLREFTTTHGVSTGEFASLNDGDEIGPETCVAIADAIEANREEYNTAFACTTDHRHGWGCYGPDPATEHAKAWRESGGMRQW